MQSAIIVLSRFISGEMVINKHAIHPVEGESDSRTRI